jgi:hypothetical protein
LPSGLVVNLAAFQGMTPAFEVEAPAEADGTYVIEDVEYDPGFVYFARVEANGLTFNSDILHGRELTGDQADLPIHIFDTTSDTAGLRTDRLHIFFDFSKPGVMQVVELFIISNPGDHVVVGPSPDQPVVSFELPAEASNLQFENGELGGRYVQTDNGFGDRMSISPGMGQHQVLFAYEMPYNRSLDFNVRVPLAVDAAVVMLPPAGVKLKSDQLADAGERNMQGMSFQMYQAVSRLEAGDSLTVNLSGNVRADGAAAATSEDGQLTYLLLGVGAFGLALIGAGLWMVRQQRSRQLATDGPELLEDPVQPVESSEAVLDAILALDDLHASGGLAEDKYQQRRAELKARLADAMDREKGA